MGNQLTAIAPSQILPVEQYLSDVTNFNFVSSLGSTRFFKVAKVLSKEGLTIVKVFVVHDPSLQLKGYKAQIEEMKNSLNWVLNCSPFQSIIQTDKAVMLCRQFVHHSLYDRISTRPFLTLMEKKWIAFLLLNALDQCHKLSVYHGDIKSENVLITAWNWVLLTDFANFKPIFLPDNNPADFSYYFDTSNRRSCYIAPERFVEATTKASVSDLFYMAVEPTKNGELTAAMDVFSAGCVLIELFTDGGVAFDLSQLLAYRAGEYYPQKLIDSIESESVRELVSHMIRKDPSSRLSIEKYLSDHRGRTFPEIFTVFLKPYCQRFASCPSLNADERIARIQRDFSLIYQKITQGTNRQDSEKKESFLIILPIVTSCIRKLQLVESKLMVLDLLCKFSPHLSSDVILDRIVPQILDFSNDKFAVVRCEMLRVLRFCLAKTNSLPSCDSNMFTEYVFPLISSLASDNECIVRIDFAQNVASFAENAVRFLELIQLLALNDVGEQANNPKNSFEVKDIAINKQFLFDVELQALQEFIQQKVVQLLGDRENCVKRTLLENGIDKLCIFFGRHKANDFLFSHMITFLNDKHDWLLRASFFNNVVGVATYLGWQCSSVLKPLLQQGLSDAEEFDVVKSLLSLGVFIELGLLQKNVVFDLIKDVLPLSFHPNIWIRKGVVGFVSKLSQRMHLSDLHCHLLPPLSNFMTAPTTSTSNEIILLESLTSPLPRQIYKQLARSLVPLGPFLAFLGKSTSSVEGIEASEGNAALLRKLSSQGMTEIDGVKIMAMADHLRGLHRYKTSEFSLMNGNNQHDGMDRSKSMIDLIELLNCEGYCDLCKQFEYKALESTALSDSSAFLRAKAGGRKFKNTDHLMNEDWKQMFGPENAAADKTSENFRHGEEPTSRTPSSWDRSEPCKKMVQESTLKPVIAQCKIKLKALMEKNREQYFNDRTLLDGMDLRDWKEKSSAQDWKPSGVMVAHLHEHRGAVNRLRASSDNMFFATCSNDGSVKIWDTTRFDGKSITNRSRMTYSKQPGQLKTLCFCDKSQSLASASDTGSAHLFRIDSKGEPLSVKEFDATRDGLIVDMTPVDAVSESVIALATVHGSIFGWDIRAPGDYAWRVEMDQKYGLITTFDVHKQLGWITAGTSTGSHVCWDMRFLLPINTVSHPNASRVRRLVVDNKAQSVILSSAQCNNELTIFDIETSTRQKTLWASPTPVLGYAQSTKHYFGGIFADSNFVITAGSDMRLRYWDLKMPRESYIIAGAANDHRNVGSKVSYHSRLIEATAVVYEAYEPHKTANEESKEEAYFDNISVGHRDTITDLVVCFSSQRYIVTSSRDGIVKVWK